MRKLNPTLVGLLGGVAVLLLIIAYFATSRSSEQDKVTQNQTVRAAKLAQPGKRCASQATYELIKREIFARAAQMRGNDQAAYAQIASYAVIRMQDPAVENQDSATGGVTCSGSISLDLPPGVMMTDGRRTLTSDINYSVDVSGNVTLKNADAFIAPLATLSRSAAPVPSSAQTNEIAPAQPAANGAAPSPTNSL